MHIVPLKAKHFLKDFQTLKGSLRNCSASVWRDSLFSIHQHSSAPLLHVRKIQGESKFKRTQKRRCPFGKRSSRCPKSQGSQRNDAPRFTVQIDHRFSLSILPRQTRFDPTTIGFKLLLRRLAQKKIIYGNDGHRNGNVTGNPLLPQQRAVRSEQVTAGSCRLL